jgi:transcriptional regulator with GAF, ATPase, and Fis domain
MRIGGKAVNTDGTTGAQWPAGTLRAQQLASTFVALADTLVDDFDVLDLLAMLTERCVTVIGASAAGLMLIDQRGGLQVAAASSEAARLLELFELQASEGPCLDCCRTGLPVSEPDLNTGGDRWPAFGVEARALGFQAVQAVPMRLRGNVVGALNLFQAEPGEMQPEVLEISPALADVATIALLQERAIRRSEALAEQLQAALNSRIVLEQAKGVLVASGAVDMDHAFAALRGYARDHNHRLAELAAEVVTGRGGRTMISKILRHTPPGATP